MRDLYAAPPADPPAAPTAADPAAPAPAATEVTPGAPAPPPEVKLRWSQISTLHRGFFSDPNLKATLARALAPHVNGTPEVEVGYDALTVRGWLMLKVPPGGLALQVKHTPDRIQLQDLRPLTVALDDYRLAMGSHYDLRLLNFRIKVEVRGGGRTCVFSPAGDPPPDGNVISPCVILGGQPECGDASRDGVRFSAATDAAVRGCLGLSGG